MDEIANILGVEEATTKTQGWFAAQTPAIKNIINKMTGEELTALDIKVEEIALHSYDQWAQWNEHCTICEWRSFNLSMILPLTTAEWTPLSTAWISFKRSVAIVDYIIVYVVGDGWR